MIVGFLHSLLHFIFDCIKYHTHSYCPDVSIPHILSTSKILHLTSPPNISNYQAVVSLPGLGDDAPCFATRGLCLFAGGPGAAHHRGRGGRLGGTADGAPGDARGRKAGAAAELHTVLVEMGLEFGRRRGIEVGSFGGRGGGAWNSVFWRSTSKVLSVLFFLFQVSLLLQLIQYTLYYTYYTYTFIFLILVRVSWKKCWKAWAILTNPVVTATDFLGSLSLPGVLDDLPRIRRERTRLLRSVLARRRTRCQKGDFLDALLEAQKKHGFGDDLIIETLVSLTTAGISTVATALEWLLLLLAQDRSAQERARNDGDFLDACILEALRLKTPLFIPRRCLEDIQVAGFTVKADSLLLPDSYKLAHDDTLWDSPKDFRPERFLGKERSFLTFKPGTQLPRCPFNRPSESAKFLPFGLGARFCPGAPLAMEQLRSFMEKLLTLQWRAENRTVDLSEAYSFTLTPANPARLIFALAEKWGIGVFASFKTGVSQLMCKKFMAWVCISFVFHMLQKLHEASTVHLARHSLLDYRRCERGQVGTSPCFTLSSQLNAWTIVDDLYMFISYPGYWRGEVEVMLRKMCLNHVSINKTPGFISWILWHFDMNSVRRLQRSFSFRNAHSAFSGALVRLPFMKSCQHVIWTKRQLGNFG